MIEKFRDIAFHGKSLNLISQAKSILQEYAEKNINVILRQLYYQMVSRAIILNKVSAYRSLVGLMRDARYTGLVDWDHLEDRTRIPYRHAQFESINELIECAARSYRLDRWAGQEYYLELWTEKDALSSVLKPIANKHHIYFCVNRGFDSATAMYDASCRLREALKEGKKPEILYLGDHDPSGMGMIEDIENRLNEFLNLGEVITVRHIALTGEQIEKYNPPANVAKESDPRYKDYEETYGKECWEVDALPPDVMIELVDNTVDSYINKDKMNIIIDQEQKDIKKLIKKGGAKCQK